MKTRYGIMAFLFMAVGLLQVQAAEPLKVGDERDTKAPYPLELEAYASPWIADDRNGDGIIDHAVQKDKNGQNSAEVYDFNFDGKMDDFYLYENNMIVMEVLDTNYDGQVDLWVHIYKGTYISGYERDSNFDGRLDVVKQYGKTNLVKR